MTRRRPERDAIHETPERYLARTAPSTGARISRTTVIAASTVMSTALTTHQMQIAWIVNTSRYVR